MPARQDKVCSVDCFVSPNEFFDWRNSKQLSKLHACWVEIDTRDHAILSADQEARIVDEVLEQLVERNLPSPTAYVLSGSGGLHLYWIFEGVQAFHWRKFAWKAMADKLCDLPGGALWSVDHGASKDPARVLRMVGSIHSKSGRSVDCRIGGPLYQFESLAKQLGVPCFEPPRPLKSIAADSSKVVAEEPSAQITPVEERRADPQPRKSTAPYPNAEAPQKHSIKGWWFRIYTQIVSDLRRAGRPVVEGRRDNTAYILYVALRHIVTDPDQALERVKELNAELIHLPEKDLIQYLSTAKKTLYKYKKDTLADFLEQQVGIKADFLFRPSPAPLTPDEVKARQAHAARTTAINRLVRTRQRLISCFQALQQTCLTVTQSLLSERSGFSMRTVKRHWRFLLDSGATRSLSIYSPLSL